MNKEQLSRTLGAAAALRQFSLPLLEAYSGVRRRTLQRFITKNDQLFTQEGTTKVRSGKSRQYSVKLYHVRDIDQIRGEVKNLEG